ncbi:MAG: branched-chain amino acid ABC transporter permease [Proteobacteria bacterium]|nr:branched-chain amino acid ABC transporter permease [Burkholderiales bacterium]
MITFALISGIGMGSMYGLIALGFYITHAVSNTVNFAQGTSMMLGAVLCYVLLARAGLPLPLAIAAALVGCAAWGVLVERFAVRPFVRRGSNAWLLSTVACGIILENVVLFTFGKEPRGMPAYYTGDPIELGGLALDPMQIVIPVVGIGVAAALHLYSTRTRFGRALLAIVQNPRAASLMGIDVATAIMLCYAVSTVFAGIAGILIAPLMVISADMGNFIGVKAFAVAILGGVNSAWGVVIAGLLYGITEALVTSYLGSAYTNILAFSLVIVALVFMPHGLLGRAAVKKV